MAAPPFPELRVVALDRCALHEETDAARVERLVARLSADGLLRNPPILGRHAGSAEVIVLDGATRVTALRALGAPHVVAQVVDYDDDSIQLHTWSHVLSGTTLDALQQALRDEPSLRLQACVLPEVERALAEGQALAGLADQAGRCLALGASGDAAAQAASLRGLFAIYATHATVARVPPTEWRARLREGHAAVAVVFPIHTKADLLALARAGAVLPAGITRHIIPGRALRVNAPLSLMRDERALEEKQAWLDAWVRDRRASHGVRYYAEPTFLFDE